jgi:hypothetical protein
MHRHPLLRALIVIFVLALLSLLVLNGRSPSTHAGSDGASPRHASYSNGANFPEPTRAEGPAGTAAPAGQVHGSIAQRLRCTHYRRSLGRRLPQDVLSLLCDRRPLDAVKLLSSMAEAGDERGRVGLGLLGNLGGSCDILKPSVTFPTYVDSMMKRAMANGATSQMLQRLSEILAEQQAGPTLDELEACRQAGAAFKRLGPAATEKFARILGRSIETLRGESELDVQIEYDRKTLVPGDADGQLKLAFELQQRGTADSQAEAEALFRQAAGARPAARSELAKCLLNGCPTPASDPSEARELLADAALAGDYQALIMLSGATDPKYLDLTSIVPATEQYAWSQFRERLNEEGCFGTDEYIGWVAFPHAAPNLMAMSPRDASAAQARAAALVAEHLNHARAALRCD